MQISLNGITTNPPLSGMASAVGSHGTEAAGGVAQSNPFSTLFTEAVGQVGKLEDQAQAAVAGLVTGAGVDIHQAMIATQKASMAFEMVLAVRNKAVQAYQQVIGMQF
jgi:flagellar hook-basal body complex protein FliE